MKNTSGRPGKIMGKEQVHNTGSTSVGKKKDEPIKYDCKYANNKLSGKQTTWICQQESSFIACSQQDIYRIHLGLYVIKLELMGI